jgi:hypothetical protein
MSKINGEKARAAVAKRNRLKQREKTRAMVAELRLAGKTVTPGAPQKQNQDEK